MIAKFVMAFAMRTTDRGSFIIDHLLVEVTYALPPATPL
jgi:hypothetical protein